MDENLGHTLEKHRKARGLSLAALATAAGVHRSTLSRWERGKTAPFVHELTRVLDVLGLNQQERLAFYQRLEAPRAVQVADTGATNTLPVSSGELLRALRQRAGVPRSVIAKAADVSPSLVIKWENGECWPNAEHLHAFCFAIGATSDELVFLTTRAWRYMEPLPLDKDALDGVVLHLERHDTTPTRSGIYLALAARYHALYRADKISEVEATGVYGSYAYYLAWRLGRFQEAGRIAAPVLAGLGNSRSQITSGQREAVMLYSLYGDRFGEGDGEVGKVGLEEKRALLNGIESRVSPNHRAWYLDMIATAWGNAGHIDEATQYFERSIAAAYNAEDAAIRRDRLIQVLCRRGRFRQAALLLMPTPQHEPRVVIRATNLFYHVQVLVGLGDYTEASKYLSHAITFTSQHHLTQFDDSAARFARVIAGDRSG